MTSTIPNVNTLWARVLVDELARCGVRHCVVSPGSRSTPLAIAFAEHPDITDFSVLDERSAAYFALGLSKRSGRPCALVCTSGTAAANYLPAICEAGQAHVPLLVFTADRPAHLHDSSAPQTMDQLKLYGDHVRWFLNVAQPEADDFKLRSLRSTICHAVAVASGMNSGPVHLNIGFRKPLEPVEDPRGEGSVPEAFLAEPGLGMSGRPDGHPYTRYWNCSKNGYAQASRLLTNLLRRQRRILIVAGPDENGRSYAKALLRFVEATGIPVFAEAMSQLRSGVDENPFLGGAGLFLRNGRCRAMASAHLILRLGDAATLKPVQDFLSDPKIGMQIVIGMREERIDPDFTATHRIVADEAILLELLSDECARRPLRGFDYEWAAALFAVEQASIEALHRELESRVEMFEGHVYHDTAAILPQGAALCVSNSMPVRDLETFVPRLPARVSVWCNRGLNGIDGVTSTAFGVARSQDGRVVLVTGDVAFLHDLGGLLIAARAGVSATVVVVNNNGGEIFGTLPIGHFEPIFTRHFLTPHGITLRHAAELAGAAYEAADNRDVLRIALEDSFERRGLSIIEVRTPERAGIPARKEIFTAISASLDVIVAELPEHLALPPPSFPQFPLAWHTLRDAVGEKVPVVCIHGFSRDARMWDSLIPLLEDGFPVFAVDLMGHGASPAPKDDVFPEAYSVEYNTARLFDALGDAGIERCHLIGYSMGGRVALHAAAQEPASFASLILLSASPGIEDPGERAQRLSSDHRLAAEIERDGLEIFVDAWLRTPAFSTLHLRGAEFLHQAKEERMRQNSRGLAGALRGMGQGTQLPLWAMLRSLAMPVQLVAGAHDGKYHALCEIMRTLIPDARLHVVEDAGHDLVAESAIEVATVINEFLASML
jgi:2-succinyl-5-enolpyruvyl-6-hydroxy-3-cyclohexene-1-carboxylate synthase